jgi:hypothetical protein
MKKSRRWAGSGNMSYGADIGPTDGAYVPHRTLSLLPADANFDEYRYEFEAARKAARCPLGTNMLGDAGLDCAFQTQNGIIPAIDGNQSFALTNERHAGF